VSLIQICGDSYFGIWPTTRPCVRTVNNTMQNDVIRKQRYLPQLRSLVVISHTVWSLPLSF